VVRFSFDYFLPYKTLCVLGLVSVILEHSLPSCQTDEYNLWDSRLPSPLPPLQVTVLRPVTPVKESQQTGGSLMASDGFIIELAGNRFGSSTY